MTQRLGAALCALAVWVVADARPTASQVDVTVPADAARVLADIKKVDKEDRKSVV